MLPVFSRVSIPLGSLLVLAGWSLAEPVDRLPIAFKIDPTLDATQELPLSAISVVEPSPSAISTQLSVDDLSLYLRAQDPNAALLSGTNLSSNGNFPAALALLSQALTAYPSDPALRLRRMETALQAGSAHIALADALFLINSGDDNPLNYISVLAGLARDERWADINRLEVNDLGQPVFNFIAQAVWTLSTLDADDPESTLSRVERAFAIGGFEDRQQYLLGLALLYLDEPEQALGRFGSAMNSMNLGGQRAALWAHRAAQLSGEDVLAADLQEHAFKNAERAHQLYGLAQIEFDQTDDAPTKRELVVEMLMQLAWLFAEREDLATASVMADFAWLVDGGDQRTSTQLAILRLGTVQSDASSRVALALADSIPQGPSGSTLRLNERVDALLGLERFDDALALIDQVESEALLSGSLSVPPRLLALRGRALHHAKRYEAAITAFERWEQAHGPEHQRLADWSTYFEWASAYFWIGESELMEQKIREALRLNPDNAFASNFLAYSWVDRGLNLEEGLEMLLAANERSPNRASIMDSVGWAYYRLGDYDQALAFIEQAWSIESNSWEISDHLGDVYQALGRDSEARWFWRRALGLENLAEDRAILIQAKLADAD